MSHAKTVVPDGAQIRQARLEAGLSAPQLAARLGGRHRQTIHRIERGAIPRVSELLIYQLARVLERPVGEFIKDAA